MRCLNDKRFIRISQGLVLPLIGLTVGVIAGWLNWHFYRVYGGFYDSMSYMNHLAWVFHLAQEKGIWEAIHESGIGSTVFLPWLLGAFLSCFAEPSRILGVVVQMPLLFLQLIAGYWYFRSVAGVDQWPSALFAMTLIAYPAAFNFNGGLCDFRVDISQAYAYGAFLALLAIARKNNSFREWFCVGIVVSIACLVRATTPVYVFFVMGTMFLVDMRQRGLAAVLPKYCASFAVIVLLTGWFYIGNYDYLHYYYFVWNTDANARLPISESATHILHLFNHLGPYLLSALLFSVLAGIYEAIRSGQWRAFRFNWTPMIGTLVPISYLVFSGAGLNPFVSMVAVPGSIMFALRIGDRPDKARLPVIKRHVPVVLGIAMICSLIINLRDFDKKISDWIPYKSGIANLADTMISDAQVRGDTHIQVAFLYLGSVDGSVIINHLIYEEGYRYQKGRTVVRNGVSVGIRQYGFAAEAEWRAIPGASDQAKLEYVVQDALSNTGYIIMAEKDSNLPAHHRINGFADKLRAQLSNETIVERIKSMIVLAKTEKVSLYRINRVLKKTS